MPLDLQGRDAFLRRGRSPERVAPVPEFDSRFFVNCANPDRVLLFAVPAAPEITIISLAGLGIGHLVDIDATTVDTAGICAPTLMLQKLDR